MSSHHTRSNHNGNGVENARRFLWDTGASDASDTEGPNRRPNNRGTNGAFSTREFNVVDQSINLMDLGSSSNSSNNNNNNNNIGNPAANHNNNKKPAGTLSGLFRARMESENLNRFTDEYGDADAMNQADAEEYITKRPRRLPPLRCNPRRKQVSPKVLLTMGMAIMALVLVFSSLRSLEEEIEDEKANHEPTPRGSDSESAQPTDPILQQRMEDFQKRILDQGITPASALGGAGTPPKQALDWIVLDDPANLDHDHPAAMDRYGLAVLYFGLGQHGWRRGRNWLSGRGICSWQGIVCAPREQEASAETNYEPYTTTYDQDSPVIGIQLGNNLMRGTIPDELGTAFGELVTIDLEDNHLIGPLPVALSQSQHLRNLLLGHNQLTGTLPHEYATLKNLHKLSVSHNHLAGSIPKEWESGLTKLRYLSVSHNQLTGGFPDLTQTKRLTGLFLEGNELEGKLPESLEGMTSLLDLRISNNKFSGGIAVLDALSNLETLDLANNGFDGTIPDMFDQLFHLHELVLANNKFEGTIPHTIPHLKTLKTLDLDSNQLDGTLPHGLGVMTDIVTMSLRNNRFEGTIPTHLGKLDDIRMLSLDQNKLTGSIPTELGSCFRLNTLHLHRNQLTGSIPSELGDLVGLSDLKLEGNGFEGANMPSQVCALRDDDLSVLTSDCKNDQKVTCDCCTECQ